jgi:RNA polymerase sigma-70 factor (ECF subfamily)
LNTLFQCGVLGQESDAELIDRFVKGRDQTAEAAFTALVERHGAMVLGVCRRVLGDREEAEDAFQATFLVLARKAASIAKREELASWLHGVARHAARDARIRVARQRAREKRWTAMRPVESQNWAVASELHAVLDEEIARLGERYRAAIVVCELEGLSRRQAAERLGVSEGTLSSRLSRAKVTLRERLTRRGFALSAAGLSSALARDANAILLPPLLADSTIRVAAQVAAGSSLAGVASISVVSLTEGVLKTMLLAKLKYAFLGLVVATVASASLGVMAQGPGPKSDDGDRLRSLEKKLDRLLEVLGGGQATRPMLPPPVAAAPAPIPADRPGAPVAIPVPPVPPGTAPAPGADQRPWVPHAPQAPGEQARRIEGLERRMGELEHRLGQLEGRMNKVAFFMRGPAANATDVRPPQASDDIARDPFQRPSAPDAPPPIPGGPAEPRPSADSRDLNPVRAER